MQLVFVYNLTTGVVLMMFLRIFCLAFAGTERKGIVPGSPKQRQVVTITAVSDFAPWLFNSG